MEFQHEIIIYECFFDLEGEVGIECFSDIFNTSAIAPGGGGGDFASSIMLSLLSSSWDIKNY